MESDPIDADVTCGTPEYEPALKLRRAGVDSRSEEEEFR
jgi:hypothetical protein